MVKKNQTKFSHTLKVIREKKNLFKQVKAIALNLEDLLTFEVMFHMFMVLTFNFNGYVQYRKYPLQKLNAVKLWKN